MTKAVHILQLYPQDMNIYGDHGNLLVLRRRLEWHGYSPVVTEYNVGDSFPETVDIVIGGGGQDSGQEKIHKDLLKIAPRLRALAEEGVPMLVVCGLYQLFGKFFQTSKSHRLEGACILDVETFGSSERLIGNVITTTEEFGDIMGYENHSGQTQLGDAAVPLATVVKGAGNNATDGHEGARYKNVIGTYLHGSVLPKNPLLADFLIETAVTRRYGSFTPQVIDDSFAEKARGIAAQRPR